MRARRPFLAIVVTALTALTTWSGAVTASASTGSVSLSSDTVGLTFTGETVAADGTVTDDWTNAAGWQFEYTGPAGAQVQVSLTPSGATGGTLDMSANSGATTALTTSWCVKAIQGTGHKMTACNLRKTLARQSSGYLIADDMTSQAHASGGLVYDAVYVSYNWSGNKVVTENPLGDVGSHCSPLTVGFSWNGVSLSYTEVTCQGTLHPWGQSESKGGGIWQAGMINPTSTIGIEELLKTSAPSSSNPNSVLHLRSIWN